MGVVDDQENYDERSSNLERNLRAGASLAEGARRTSERIWTRLPAVRRLNCLAANLAIAGALCAAFEAGYVDGYHTANRERGIPTDPRYPDLRDWRPNTDGKAMP